MDLRRKTLWRLLLAGLCWWLLSSSPKPMDALEQVRALGMLRVATVNGPLTIYETAQGRAGFEFDLVSGLAQHLGVATRWLVYGSLEEARDAVALGNAHLLAAAWTPPPLASHELLTTQPYRSAQYRVAYHRNLRQRPRKVADLAARDIWVGQEALLHLLQEQVPEANGRRSDQTAEILLERVAREELPMVLVDSDTLFIARRGYPGLREGPAIGDPLDKVWAVSADHGEALRRVANTYLRLIDVEGRLALLRDRHFQHLDRLDSFSRNAFRSRINTRLPKYRALFEQAAARYGLDWRFLAAVAYQESSWDESAVSATGVRGLMMLTRVTAREMKVRRRSDPAQSVDGGARYFLQLHARMPEEAPEPDRTWMTLAAYNLGMGHLYDLRRLTAELGGEPNRWVDLRDNLPKLMQPRWYKSPLMKYGYARGTEARAYVGNIRAYYDLLRWLFPEPGEKSLDVEQPLKPFAIRLPPEPRELPEILIPAL